MHYSIICLILVCKPSFIMSSMSGDKLEVINEKDLRQLFIEEKFVITLFSDKEICSGKCENLENALLSVREDLVEDTGGWVIKSYAPSLAQEMGIQGSGIIFMREGRPLLYSGNSQDEEKLLKFLLNNKVSVVHNLTDANFEHETQAGTGATTGDWFVMFSRRDCAECQKLFPVLEAVSVNLKGRKNTAVIEREVGAVTARRFGVKTFPTFVLFRLGNLYRYIMPIQDVQSLTAFAEDSFRNVKGEDVPPPKSPFDDVTEAAADWLKENPGTFLIATGGILLAVIIIFLLNRPPPESWTTKKIKKKKH